MRRYETSRDSMRHYETLRDSMRHYATIGDIIDPMGLYETAWDTDTIGDIVRQYETRAL